MTVGYSRVADLNSYFNDIYADAVFTLREQTLGVRLVKKFTDGRGDQTRTLTSYPSVTPVEVAETEDFAAPTRFDKSLLATLTPIEEMAQIILTDRRIETDQQDAASDASIELGAGLADKVDTNILGNFNSLTGGTVGASGSTMTWSYFYAAASIMRKNKVPRPWYCVMHPYHYHDLGVAAATGATVTNAPQFQDEVMRQWYVGTIAGVDLFIDGNCEEDGTDAYSAIFNPSAMAFDLRRDYRMERERDASKRAWELNSTLLYAHGVWRPTWGVQIIADVTTPV